MSVFLSKKGKAAGDAEKFLRNLNNKQKNILKQKQALEQAEKKATPLKKYIKTRQELTEIETLTTKAYAQKKAKIFKEKLRENMKTMCSSLSEISEIHLKINEYKEKTQAQEKKILENLSFIKEFSRPQRELSNAAIKKVQGLEEKVKAAEARLSVLMHSEKLASSPDKLEEFVGKIGDYAEPEIIVADAKDAWSLGPSEVRELMMFKYREIREMDEKIYELEEVLRRDLAEDLGLQKEAEEKILHEKQNVNMVYQKKMDRALEMIRITYLNDINKTKQDVEDLEKKLAIVHLSFRK
ncbi:hypothetical protein SteCoe_31994 [Stentor coeruleus]|uniref:Uncharacterized protein n=1 Tax=Stentor coeruleus TaxID=5963 RepID=A0A1R2B003_9CILI|nr:hypothetical protein SteCoe_31994 [Stentor coeruleus]